MGELMGSEIVKLAEAHGWRDRGGSRHLHILDMAGRRPVPVRRKLKNYNEARGILKQLGIPRDAWPDKLR